MTYEPRRSGRATACFVAITFSLAALTLGLDCEVGAPQPEARKVYMLDGSDLTVPGSTENRTWFETVDSSVDRVCIGPDKVVCDWNIHPASIRYFEQWYPGVGHRDGLDGTMTVSAAPEQIVHCSLPTTRNGTCEDYGPMIKAVHDPDWRPWTPEAYTFHDIGECSGSFPTQFFMTLLREAFQDQADDRLGAQVGPEGEDIALWLDFIVNLGDHPDPVLIWADYSAQGVYPHGILGRFPGKSAGFGAGEIVLESEYKVDGDLSFDFDPTWLGDSTGSRILSIGIQTAIFTTLFPTSLIFPFLGNCDKDRDLRMHIRGQLAPSADGGVGIKLNLDDTCGPDERQRCTWVAVGNWPKIRAICNNRVKPQIESNFLNGLIVGLQDENGLPRNLVVNENGDSLLPWRDSRGRAIPIKRVVHTPTDVHFVLLEKESDDPALYDTLEGRGLCGADRASRLSNDNWITLLRGGFR